MRVSLATHHERSKMSPEDHIEGRLPSAMHAIDVLESHLRTEDSRRDAAMALIQDDVALKHALALGFALDEAAGIPPRL